MFPAADWQDRAGGTLSPGGESTMNTEFVIVWFPRKKAYYRVAVNRATEEAVWRLDTNLDGYYDLVIRSDETVLWKYAQAIKPHERPPSEAEMTASRR